MYGPSVLPATGVAGLGFVVVSLDLNYIGALPLIAVAALLLYVGHSAVRLKVNEWRLRQRGKKIR